MYGLLCYMCQLFLLYQKSTQSNGRRPFGISFLIVGFDEEKVPKLYQTEPAGTYHEWKVSWPLEWEGEKEEEGMRERGEGEGGEGRGRRRYQNFTKLNRPAHTTNGR